MKSKRWKNLKYELKKDRQAVFALMYLAVIIVISLAVVLIPRDPNALNVSRAFEGPSREYFFGTDEVGRDYLLRCLYGGRISLLVGVLAMATSVFIGVSVGIVAGYFGGWIDDLLMRAVDLISSIPYMILVTVFSLFLKPGVTSIILVLGFFTWMEIARLVRAETLSFKEREYVQYARFIGMRSGKVILKHILPSVLPTVITSATATIAGAIMAESALSFLGLGIQQPMSSWGSLLQTAQQSLQKAPYMAVLPGALIFLTVFSFNKIGDVLRVIVQPNVTEGAE